MSVFLSRCFLYIFFIIPFLSVGQTIQLYSILQARQIGGDQGYTFDGKHMITSSRLKLLNPYNFGPNGTYPKSVKITDDFQLSGSLTEISKIGQENLLFFGNFNKVEPTLEAFTEAEIDSIYNWSMRGGKMIITVGLDLVATNFYTSILSSKWKYTCATISSGSAPVIATAAGKNCELFNGPFGSISSIRQGAGAQGFYLKYPNDIKVMAETNEGRPTVYLDCTTLDLLVVDVDVYTSLSQVGHNAGITPKDQITSANDMFLANTIVFMDKLQGPPVMVKNGNEFSVQNNYLHYQWYRNGEAIVNSNSSRQSIEAAGSGSYYVEVETNGGCILRTKESECDFFVPTAFSPDNNNMNEKACVYSSCFEKIDFKIFDRWGELIFRSNESEKCWDGTYKGIKANSGVYAWSLEATRISGSKLNKKGNITLIR